MYQHFDCGVLCWIGVHLGDLGQTKLTDEQIEAVGDVDILFVPVGGKYTIDSAGAESIIKDIEPKIITQLVAP